MEYSIKGNLRGLLCSDCYQPIVNTFIRVYRPENQNSVTALAVAQTKETFHQVSEEEIRGKQGRLLAEVPLNEKGDFSVSFGENNNYDGGVVEIDWYCGTVPVKIPPKRLKETTLQFHLTTLQPSWTRNRENENIQQYYWEYSISSSWFCRILSLFGLWVVCGKVTSCKDGIPVSNLRVFAFDVDLIQDDPLGSGVTDTGGHYDIWYTEADFSKTIFNWLNVEWPAGPDIYFRVEALDGTVLLREPRSQGHSAGRENVSNCLCVDLCVDFNTGGPGVVPVPAFLRIGGIDYQIGVHSAPFGNGLTNGNYAFYNTLRLNGIVAQTFGGQPMEYRFEYTDQYDGVGEPTGWQPVLPGQIAATRIGYLEKATLVALPFPHYVYNNLDYYVSNAPIGGALTTPIAADGWILVPQQHDDPTNVAGAGLFVSNGDQIDLISQTLNSFPPIDLTGLQAGNSSTSTGKALAQDKVFAVRMMVRQQGNNATVTEAGVCRRFAVDNTLYNNISHHPEWGGYTEASTVGVNMVDIAQLQVAGCAKITTQADILYTCAHPNLGSIGLTLTGPSGMQNLGPIAASTDAAGIITHTFLSTDPLCAYQVTLSATFLLTTGDSNEPTHFDQIAFCR